MRRSPWHSVKQSVHHDNTECNTGNNIERENLRQGTGGKPLCKECARLIDQVDSLSTRGGSGSPFPPLRFIDESLCSHSLSLPSHTGAGNINR